MISDEESNLSDNDRLYHLFFGIFSTCKPEEPNVYSHSLELGALEFSKMEQSCLVVWKTSPDESPTVSSATAGVCRSILTSRSRLQAWKSPTKLVADVLNKIVEAAINKPIAQRHIIFIV